MVMLKKNILMKPWKITAMNTWPQIKETKDLLFKELLLKRNTIMKGSRNQDK